MNRILYFQYTNPAGYPPLQHSSAILAEAGCQILFLGTGAAGADSLEFPPHKNIEVRRIAFRASGWRQKLHYLGFCAWVLWTVLTWRPRWVYASDAFSCPAASILTFIPGVRVIYHEHDSPAAGGGAFAAMMTRARALVALRADICILPNAERLIRFQSESGRVGASFCVWNCPGAEEAREDPKGEASARIWLLYHGSIVPDRLPISVIDALALLPDSVCLRVAGYETVGSRGYSAELSSRARELGLQDRVEFLGAMQRADLRTVGLRSHIGLALMPMTSSDLNLRAMIGASNKAFEYLACGQALLVSDLPDWRSLFVEPGYALSCDPGDPRSIATAIRGMVDNPARMRAMGESGRRRILSAWNYEMEFAPVLERVLTGRKSAAPGKKPAFAASGRERSDG